MKKKRLPRGGPMNLEQLHAIAQRKRSHCLILTPMAQFLREMLETRRAMCCAVVGRCVFFVPFLLLLLLCDNVE
eukprot:CAMPEP_0179456232 /NCGR_PEP_ID=MMETSP0799-20121207/39994_1 /TAXON_ID=46947 /ORGANISM="Geminigera cryophila, Strain CCMP2564" /LENGTH=73 /DNA_ID=CAMNT_0021255701 /DNA_START=65 /DNA_END=286 /DNA_ORIENTATION=+